MQTEKPEKPAAAPVQPEKKFTTFGTFGKVEVRGERTFAPTLTPEQRLAKELSRDAEAAKRQAAALAREKAHLKLADHPLLPFQQLEYVDREIMLDRWGGPIWQWRNGVGVAPADPDEPLPTPVRKSWFFSNNNPPYGNGTAVDRAVAALAGWGITYDAKENRFHYPGENK